LRSYRVDAKKSRFYNKYTFVFLKTAKYIRATRWFSLLFLQETTQVRGKDTTVVGIHIVLPKDAKVASQVRMKDRDRCQGWQDDVTTTRRPVVSVSLQTQSLGRSCHMGSKGLQGIGLKDNEAVWKSATNVKSNNGLLITKQRGATNVGQVNPIKSRVAVKFVVLFDCVHFGKCAKLLY
jgi:hypothetical protein